ncbi:MAG: hypothetical protein P8O20_00005, partial [Bacteroidia bacterium]|nr:hypothetical protein [Bacteroidia bacterium]
FFFFFSKTVVDLIDDELTVSDYHKCAGTEVSMSSRALRLGTGAVNSASKHCTKSCPTPGGPPGCNSCRMGSRMVSRYLGS